METKTVKHSQNEKKAIQIMAEVLSMSPDNNQEVIEKSLQLKDLKKFHDHGLTRLSFAKMASRYRGLENYVCSYALYRFSYLD